MTCSYFCLPVAVLILGAHLIGQPPPVPKQGLSKGEPPVLMDRGVLGGSSRPVDEGVAPQLFENPNIERFLAKAKEFVARAQYDGAVEVLQAILEGRTHEDEPGTSPDHLAGEDPLVSALTSTGSPTLAVYSIDRRRFRPVLQVCLELLASLPTEGRLLYRNRHEVAAGLAFSAAARANDPMALQEVAERWFLTEAAGRALKLAGDLWLDAGAGASALQAYGRLLEIYPKDLRAKVTSDAWLRLRIALCHRLQQDMEGVGRAVSDLVTHHGDESLVLAGETFTVPDLARQAWLSPSGPPGGTVSTAPRPGPPPKVLQPVFETRFTQSGVYQGARAASGRIQQAPDMDAVLPMVNQLQPGTSVTFTGDSILAFDHFRLRVFDRIGGLLRAESDGAQTMPDPVSGRARQRIPIFDWVTQRPAVAPELIFVVRGLPEAATAAGAEPILRNELVALDRATLSPRWSSRQKLENHGDLTFLAAPTTAGDSVIVPVHMKGVFSLLCVAAADGALRYLTPLHFGGSEWSRAPTPPCTVHDGIAYLLTNAGVVAAVDAHTGSKRWLRRYERLHPFRPEQRLPPRIRTARLGSIGMVRELSALTGFAPTVPIVENGVLVLAPNDGRVMLGLDAADGALRWLVSRTAPGAEYVVGTAAGRLYVAGLHVTCIDISTGLRLWRVALPSTAWHGRGAVVDGGLLLPGPRVIHVLPFGDPERFTTIPVPPTSPGRHSLSGPFNVFASGSLVALAYEDGIEVHADPIALAEEAKGLPWRARARLLAAGGAVAEAVNVLVEEFESRPAAPDPMRAADDGTNGLQDQEDLQRLLAWSQDLALAAAIRGDGTAAMAQLSRIQPLLSSHRELQRRWLLARADVRRVMGDRPGARSDLQQLQRMEQR